ncbi:hypothetical protein ACFLR3_00805 [Campylobacterota bacterium]
MVKLFPLHVITAMKLKCMSITQGHLNKAIEDGYEHEIVACKKELAELKKEAMNPMAVLESVQQYCLPSHCGNNLIQDQDSDVDNKLA